MVVVAMMPLPRVQSTAGNNGGANRGGINNNQTTPQKCGDPYDI